MFSPHQVVITAFSCCLRRFFWFSHHQAALKHLEVCLEIPVPPRKKKKLCGGFVKHEKCSKEMYKKKDFKDGRDKEKDKNPTRKYTKGRERERERKGKPRKKDWKGPSG